MARSRYALPSNVSGTRERPSIVWGQLPVSYGILDWFAARLSIAVYDVNRTTPEMSVLELKAVFPQIDAVSYAPNGNQIIHIGDKAIEVGPMASNEEIRVALQNPFIKTENTKMSITGVNSLKAKFEAAKTRKAAIESRVDTALSTYNGAADLAESAIKLLEDDAAALQAEVAGFTNGAPE
jgi:hypothetical protein